MRPILLLFMTSWFISIWRVNWYDQLPLSEQCLMCTPLIWPIMISVCVLPSRVVCIRRWPLMARAFWTVEIFENYLKLTETTSCWWMRWRMGSDKHSILLEKSSNPGMRLPAAASGARKWQCTDPWHKPNNKRFANRNVNCKLQIHNYCDDKMFASWWEPNGQSKSVGQFRWNDVNVARSGVSIRWEWHSFFALPRHAESAFFVVDAIQNDFPFSKMVEFVICSWSDQSVE